MEEAIFYKNDGTTIFMKATGHVTASVCPMLKDTVFQRLEGEPRIKEIYLDLSECEYMDSTFLGLIVGTQKRFSRLSSPDEKLKMVLFGVNEACKGLLRTIGVLNLVTLSMEKPGFSDNLPRLQGETKASAKFLLDAHEELSGLSEENRKRFSTLTTVLKSAVDAEEGKK